MSATRAERQAALPANLTPRGLSRVEAATYIGIGCSKFDDMVGDGRMPAPKEIDGRRVWDRLALDSAFAALPDAAGAGQTSENTADIWSRAAV